MLHSWQSIFGRQMLWTARIRGCILFASQPSTIDAVSSHMKASKAQPEGLFLRRDFAHGQWVLTLILELLLAKMMELDMRHLC
jgi:hypothetical protein